MPKMRLPKGSPTPSVDDFAVGGPLATITDPRRLIALRRVPSKMTRRQLGLVKEGGKPFEEQNYPAQVLARVQG